jgi:nuclear pore complex protein Nup188
MGEPASIGTLLELGNCVYETLRLLVNKASSGPGSLGQDAVSVADVAKARRALESALVYATTQLMMWLAKHDDENVNSGEMDADDAPQTEGYGQGFGGGFRADASSAPVSQKDFERDRRLKRRSMTLADRLRRGMTGEMTMDLQSLISKAKPVVLKSQDMLGKDTVDVMPILAKFVEERVNS